MQLRVTKPILELQNDSYTKLREDLYTFITETSDFPEWKQTNLSDRWSELQIKKLSTTLSTAELAELTYIDSVRAWKNTLLTERDRVKTLIYAATAMLGIRTAVDSFVYTAIPPKP